MQVLDSKSVQTTGNLAPIIFVSTIFLSASLLFFVQPLFTRIVLPQIGGSPAIWTTAMLFFQTVLIAGYFYAHLLTRYLAARMQMIVHPGDWAMALFSLPLATPDGWQFDPDGPVAWQTLLLFGASIGLPFFALSANAPLLQSCTGEAAARRRLIPISSMGPATSGLWWRYWAFRWWQSRFLAPR